MSTWVIINESSKNTWIRSRRILSKYLLQVGSTTWSGFLTYKSSENLREELNKIRNKNMSIAWYRCEKNRMLLEYVQGKNQWHTHMGYAFRTKVIPTMLQTTPVESIERTVLQLAALGHDLGKASVNFQKMLQSNGAVHEPVRHEFLSFLLLVHVGFNGKIESQKPGDVLLRWSDPECWRDLDLGKYAKDQMHMLSDTKKIFLALETWVQTQQGHPIYWILMLVLTHHRLIDGKMDINMQQQWQFNPELQNNEFKKVYVRRNTQPEDFQFVINATTPWMHMGWMGAWTSLCKKLSTLMDSTHLSQNDWSILSYAATHNLRPWLILSDYLASSMKEDHQLDYTNTVIANTLKDSTRDNHSIPADSLVTHLRKTRTSAKSWMHTLKTTAWPALQIHECTKNGLLRQTASGKFQWQQDSLEGIPVNIQHGFTIVLADTGSGKTAFSMKLMERLCSKIRVSYAVGLTTLTEQTSTSFRERLGIPGQQVLTVVGAQEKINETRKARARNNYSVGTFNDIEDNILRNDVEKEQRTLFLEPTDPYAKTFLNHEVADRALNTPILVCTADYLVHAAIAEHGDHLPWIPRICSAGLILDEIDNYAGKDINGLCKLVTMAASHGMPVVCMSATIRPSMAQALYQAWKYGHEVFCLRQDHVQEAYIGLINNVHTQHNMYKPDAPTLAWEEFIDTLLKKKEANPKQRFDIFDIPDAPKGLVYYDALLRKARELANVHLSTVGGFSLSTGFIRMNTVRDAREFAEYTINKIEKGEIPDVAVVCYHARFPIAHLAEIETRLMQWVERSDSDEKWFNRPLVKKNIDAWKKQGLKNALFLVITTSIEETGRDHDFDFCISEPSSDRSIIQAAGRVLRHRTKKIDTPNVLLINHFQREPWINPGFKNDTVIEKRAELLKASVQESNVCVSKKAYAIWKPFYKESNMDVPFSISEQVEIVQPRQAFPIEDWKQSFDSRCCWALNAYRNSPSIGISLGHFISAAYTKGIENRNNPQIGFKQWLDLYHGRWSRYHNQQTIFRESKGSNYDFVFEANEHDQIKIRLYRFVDREYTSILLDETTKPSQREVRIRPAVKHNPLDIPWYSRLQKGSKKIRQISWTQYNGDNAYDYRVDLGFDTYR